MGTFTCKCNDILNEKDMMHFNEMMNCNSVSNEEHKITKYMAENILLKKELAELKTKHRDINTNYDNFQDIGISLNTSTSVEKIEFSENKLKQFGHITVSRANNNLIKIKSGNDYSNQYNNLNGIRNHTPIKKNIGSVIKNSRLETINEKSANNYYTDNENEKFISFKEKFINEELLDNLKNETSELNKHFNSDTENNNSEGNYLSTSQEHKLNLSKIRNFNNLIKIDNSDLSINNKNSQKFKGFKNEFDQTSYNNMLTNSSYASSLDLRGNKYFTSKIKQNNKKKKNIDFVVPINQIESKINKNLLFNNNTEILINEAKILALDEDSIIYDLEMFKINLFKNEYKVSQKYCQIGKTTFKYFKSVYSSTVWHDKPLMRLPIKNIDKIVIGNKEIPKLKQNYNIKLIIQVYIKFTEDFPFDNKYELLYLKSNDGNVVETVLVFGLSDEESGINLVKILSFLRKILHKKIYK